MPDRSSTTHDHAHHAHHAHEAEGTHVMPDGTVMRGGHHDHAAHGHHDHGHHVHTPSQPKPVPGGDPGQVEYTCPMHPQVRQRGPGSCPICGMASLGCSIKLLVVLSPGWPGR